MSTTTLFNPAPTTSSGIAGMLGGWLSMGSPATTASAAPPVAISHFTARGRRAAQAAANSKKRKRVSRGPPTRVQPKRQDQSVSYAEIDSDDELINDSDDAYDEAAYAQKRPRITRRRPKNKIFPFLALPRELRDMIYAECLSDPSGVLYIEETTRRFRRMAVRVPAGPDNEDVHYEIGAFLEEAVPNPFVNPSERRQRQQRQNRAPNPDFAPNADWDTGCADDDDPDDEERQKAFVPALLGVCRQMREEAAPVLYGGHRLLFANAAALHHLLADLTPPTRALLRDVAVLHEFRWRSMKRNFSVAAFALLAEGGTELRRLCFGEEYVDWSRDSGKMLARRFYRRAFRWLEAVGRARGRKDAGVEVVGLEGSQFLSWLDGRPEKEVEFRKELRRLLIRG